MQGVSGGASWAPVGVWQKAQMRGQCKKKRIKFVNEPAEQAKAYELLTRGAGRCQTSMLSGYPDCYPESQFTSPIKAPATRVWSRFAGHG